MPNLKCFLGIINLKIDDYNYNNILGHKKHL